MAYETAQILIWAKTYPEISRKYVETVCTGGVRADGRPVRLYPVPLRYLSSARQFKLYDWIEVEIEKNTSDPRPESFKLRSDTIRVVDNIPPNDHWRARRQVVFQDSGWQFGSLDALRARSKATRQSIGIIDIDRVEGVEVKHKPKSAEREFREKLEGTQAQKDLFRASYKRLDYLPFSIRLIWRCRESNCECAKRPHVRSVLDWGLLELARRDGAEKARSHLEAIATCSGNSLRIFAGNYRQRLWAFGIIGLWYPKADAQEDLFDQAGTSLAQPAG